MKRPVELETRHQCMIYDGPPSHKLPVIAEIIVRKLEEGYRCLYLNSPPMVAGMRSTLAAMGMDVMAEVAKARLVLSSDTVSEHEHFDVDKMIGSLSDALDQAIHDGYKGLWASGDMGWEFGPRKDFSKLLEYELRLEEMFAQRQELCGICQYHNDSMPQDALRQSLLVHPGIAINSTLSRINPHYLKSAWPVNVGTSLMMDTLINELCK